MSTYLALTLVSALIQTDGKSLGNFTIVDYVRKEHFAGSKHVRVCETLRLKKDDQQYEVKFECRKEFRPRMSKPFHVGDAVNVIGMIDAKGLHTRRDDVKPVLPPHKHE